jgi:hypothetical protein
MVLECKKVLTFSHPVNNLILPQKFRNISRNCITFCHMKIRETKIIAQNTKSIFCKISRVQKFVDLPKYGRFFFTVLNSESFAHFSSLYIKARSSNEY